MLRRVNTGVPTGGDKSGGIIARVGTGETGIVGAGRPSSGPPTLYARFGDWMLLALILASWSWAMATNATARYRRMRNTVMQRCG